MLTQCPNCQTTFRVTSEILRVAAGQVRCGRCHTQFDALQRLVDESALDAEPVPESQPRSEPAQDIEVEEPAEHEEITLEGKHIEITGTYLVMDESSQDGESHLRQEVTEEWVEIDGIDDVVTVDPASTTSEEISAATDAGVAAEEPEPAPIATPENAASPAPLTEAPDFDLFAAEQRRKATPLIWKLATIPLLLLLASQIIHHYRAELARHPRLGPSVVAAYDTLGLTLTPDWNLHAYEIQHWAVVPDTATQTLNLRASITNREAFAQPYPILKLVLEDRWGDTVREREFEPHEYLDAGTATDRPMPPGHRANLQIAILDPGAEAAGFHFEACLRGRNGVVCASEVAG